MIELHHVGFGIAALLGGLHIIALRRLVKRRRSPVIMDMKTVNSSRHQLVAALTNESHRTLIARTHRDKEF